MWKLVRMKIPRPCLQRFSKSGVGPGIWICSKYLERFWCRWLGNHTLRNINIMGANSVDMDSRTVVSWEVSTNGLGLLDGFVTYFYSVPYFHIFLLYYSSFPSKSPFLLLFPLPPLNWIVLRHNKARKISPWASTSTSITSAYHIGQTVAGS